MYISDLNECLSELPEISVLEYFRSPVTGTFRWTGEDAVDSTSADFIGPILVDDRGIEYVVRPPMEATANKFMPTEPKVCRVTRPNKTRRFQDMTRSSDVPADLRRALLAFVSTQMLAKAA